MKRRDVLLTAREVEILILTMQGHSAQEIADSLCLQRCTIQFHLLNVHRKLGTNSSVQAVGKAVRLKLIPCFCQELDAKGQKR